MPSVFIFISIAFVVTIILQVFLSKKESKWIGFILPAISFIGMSYFIILGIIHDNTVLFSTTIDGETVLQTVIQMNSPLENIVRYIYIFILHNIPTAILLAIYFARRNKLNKQRAPKKSVHDL